MMKGIDFHMSHHIGKKLSALFQTLTTLTEDERGAKEEEEEEENRGAFSEAGPTLVSTEVGGDVFEKAEKQLLEPAPQRLHSPRHSTQEVGKLA